MTTNEITFNRRAVRPFDCLSNGWGIIKDDYWLFLGIALVGGIIGGAVPIILQGPMMCGIYLCLLRRARGLTIEFSMLFEGFNYFLESLIATLIQVLATIVVVVPVFVVFIVGLVFAIPRSGPGEPPNPSPGVAFYALIVLFTVAMIAISMIFQALFVFTFPLIADRKMGGWNAVKLSARAALANLGGIIVLMLVNMVLVIIGVMACFIGVYFILPITLAAQAAAYRQVFPAEEIPTVMPIVVPQG